MPGSDEPVEVNSTGKGTGDDTDELFHFSPNPENPGPTIAFIHGLASSHREFSLVYPHLETHYHILLLDLPGHSSSSHIPGSYTYVSAAQHVERTIAKHAHGGHAHIVGLSMGGFVALQLTISAPERVLSVFASGSAPFEGLTRFVAQRPWVIFGTIYATTQLIPGWLYDKICDWSGMQRHGDFLSEMAQNARYSLIREAFTSLLEIGTETVADAGRTGRRFLVVAGGRGDDVTATRKMEAVLREAGSPHSTAVVVRKALHAWDLQFPELFAAGVMAWIEEKDLPSDFEKLCSPETQPG